MVQRTMVAFCFCLCAVSGVFSQTTEITRDNYWQGNLFIQNLEKTKGDSLRHASELGQCALFAYNSGLFYQAYHLADLGLKHNDELILRYFSKADSLSLQKKEILIDLLKTLFVTRATIFTTGSRALYAIERDMDLLEEDYQKALKLFMQVGDLYAEQHISILADLGTFYLTRQKAEQAIAVFLEAMELNERTHVLNERHLAKLRNNLVFAYSLQNDRKSSIQVLSSFEAKSIIDPSIPIIFNHMANFQIPNKEYEKAELNLAKAIKYYSFHIPSWMEMRQAIIPPDFLIYLWFSAELLIKDNRPEKALKVYDSIVQLLFEQTVHSIYYLNQEQRTYFWLTIQPFCDKMQTFAYNRRSLEANRLPYAISQLKKNLFFTPSFHRSITANSLMEDQALSGIFNKVDSLRDNEARLRSNEGYLRNVISANDWEKIKNEILKTTAIEELVHHQESELKHRRHEDFENEKGVEKVWSSIPKLLHKGEALLDFIEVKSSTSGEKQYCALLLKDQGFIELFPLCSETELRKAMTLEHSKNNALWKTIWKPFKHELKGIKTVHISCTGYLNVLPFASMRDGETGEYLCEQHALLHTFSAEESLSKKEKNIAAPNKIKNVYLFGGADFGMAIPVKKDPKRGQGFAYLPGSKKEIEAISQNLLSATLEVECYTGKEASEENFRSLSWKQEPSILHVSTHGFYLPYVPDSTHNFRANKISAYRDPMLRSGFVLAGGNETWRKENFGDNEQNDGLLTANEISLLALGHVELAVLSACRTGLGDIMDTEGIFGLQRAFRLAGVKSMIVSLEEVPDKETKEFMVKFYEYWQSGLDKHKAFTDAQRFMKGRYPDEPEKWGGFIFLE